MDLKLLHVTFDGFRQVAYQVVAVGDWNGGWRPWSAPIGIQTGPIAGYDLYLRMRAKPLAKAGRRPHRQQIDNSSLLQIHQHRPVVLLLAPRPIIHSQHAHLRPSPTPAARFHSSQYCVCATGDSETL